MPTGDQPRSNSALSRCNILLAGTTSMAASALAASPPAQARQPQARAPAAAGGKPNILVIFGDDIGRANISACSFGAMGDKTPNIDRIAREGVTFTDYHAEQSCRSGKNTNTYCDWTMSDGAGVIIAGPAVTGCFLTSSKEFPPSQRPSNFSIDQVAAKIEQSWGSFGAGAN